jgi:hypothetical protein
MNKSDHMAVFMGATLFALGAVAYIIYHHMQSTKTILAAASGAAPGATTGDAGAWVSDPFGGLGQSASLAGTPIVGQEGSSVAPSVVPLNINPGYLLQ